MTDLSFFGSPPHQPQQVLEEICFEIVTFYEVCIENIRSRQTILGFLFRFYIFVSKFWPLAVKLTWNEHKNKDHKLGYLFLSGGPTFKIFCFNFLSSKF